MRCVGFGRGDFYFMHSLLSGGAAGSCDGAGEPLSVKVYADIINMLGSGK